MKSRLLLAGVVAVSLSMFAKPVLAKQCIYNKAGFILNVTWIKGSTIVRRNQLSLGQGNCSADNQVYKVVLSIQDGKLANDITKGAIYAAAAAVGVITGGTAGVVATGSATLGAVLLDKGIPDPQEIFYTGVPSSN